MRNALQTFPVSAGLLEPHHVQAIDPSSPWPIYLWFLEHVTRDEENGEDFLGIVLNGRPVSIQQIADHLGVGERVCRRHLARLVKAGYLLRKKTGVGTCTYTVTKSKRWAWKRQPRAGKTPELQANLFSPSHDGYGEPTHQKAALGSLDPQAGKRSQGADPQAGKRSDLTKNRPQQKDGSRARSHESQESHKERGRSRDTLSELPTDFAPKDSHRHLAGELNLNLDMVFRKFCDHHASKGTKFKDWDRALNTWLRREHEFGKSAGPNRVAAFRPTPSPPAWSDEVKAMKRAVGIS